MVGALQRVGVYSLPTGALSNDHTTSGFTQIYYLTVLEVTSPQLVSLGSLEVTSPQLVSLGTTAVLPASGKNPSVFLVSPGHLHPTHTSLSHVSDRVLCFLAESLSVPFPAQGPSDYNGPKPIIKGNLPVSKILYFTMHCGSHI